MRSAYTRVSPVLHGAQLAGHARVRVLALPEPAVVRRIVCPGGKVDRERGTSREGQFSSRRLHRAALAYDERLRLIAFAVIQVARKGEPAALDRDDIVVRAREGDLSSICGRPVCGQ